MSRRTLLLILLAAILACYVLLPFVEVVRDGEGWIYSANRLHQIGYALHAYDDNFRHLPPAIVTDKNGKALYSWRVLLLPFLEQDSLYKQFHLGEPWDSPHNRQFLERTPRCYSPGLGKEDPPGTTRYRVFVGPGTAFERPGLTWDDFPDGLANTLLVVEAGEPVPWSKPDELAYDPNQPLPALGGAFRKPVYVLRREWRRDPGFTAVLADGSTRFIRSDTDEQALRALITRNGGETVDWSRVK
jgi:hypothetical protein